MFRITSRAISVGHGSICLLLLAAAPDLIAAEPSRDREERSASEVAGSPEGQSQAEATSRLSEIDAPTHRQVRQLVPKRDGSPIKLNTFCVAGDGRILAACGGQQSVRALNDSGAYTINERNEPGCIVVFDARGEQEAAYDLTFRPTAINLAPDGTIFVAGDGKVAHLSADGRLIREAATPNIGDPEKFRQRAVEAAKKQAEQNAHVFQQQVEVIQKRVDEIESKPQEERSKADEARLTAYKQQLELYQNAGAARTEIDPEQTARQAMTVTAIGATDRDVFLSCRSTEGHGYTIWRTDYAFESGQPVLTNIGGCCGQMDLQCCDGKLLVAENTSFKVGIYDRDGESLGGFGRRDRSSKAGFGSCCNPMNVRPLSDGSVLTAESSIGHVKRFDLEGNLLSYIGRARVAAGCKHCCLGYNPLSDEYFMMHEDANVICVLANQANLAELTEEERETAAIREQFDARLLGTWRLGREAPRKESQSALGSLVAGLFGRGSSASVPFKTMTLKADGSLDVDGGMYASFGSSWTWSPSSGRDDVVEVTLAADQIEMLTMQFEFTGDNAATVGCSLYGQQTNGIAATRIADCDGKPCGAECQDDEGAAAGSPPVKDSAADASEPSAGEPGIANSTD